MSGTTLLTTSLQPTTWGGNRPMRRYVIERDLVGVGMLSVGQKRDVSQTSRGILYEMGTGIQWVQSFVTGDRMYCVYLAESEEIVREHAKRGGFPVSRIAEVVRMIDPLTATRQLAK